MPNENLLSIDITVIQQPVTVQFECPHCKEDIALDYKDFLFDMGEPCDWEYSEMECPACSKTLKINSIDWD